MFRIIQKKKKRKPILNDDYFFFFNFGINLIGFSIESVINQKQFDQKK